MAGEIVYEVEDEQVGSLEKGFYKRSDLASIGQDIRAITGALTKADKQPAGLSFKKTKAHTIPPLAKCSKCARDVLSCNCVLVSNKEKANLPASLIEKTKINDCLQHIELNEREDGPGSGKESLEKNEAYSNYYSYARSPPSVQATVRSLIPNCNEEVYQQ